MYAVLVILPIRSPGPKVQKVLLGTSVVDLLLQLEQPSYANPPYDKSPCRNIPGEPSSEPKVIYQVALEVSGGISPGQYIIVP